MSWDQSHSMEAPNDFFIRLLDIDMEKLIEEKLAEQGLEVVSIEEVENTEADFFDPVRLMRITLSDGRVFEHKVTHQSNGDDWGHDSYTFVEEGKPHQVERESLID